MSTMRDITDDVVRHLEYETGREDPASYDHLPTYDVDYQVIVGDTSKVGFVYYTRLMDWMGMVREQYGVVAAPNYMNNIDGPTTMLTHFVSCQYMGEIWFPDRVSIRMSVPWVRFEFMRALFRFYRLTPDGDVLVGRGEQIWASVRRENDVFSRAPWPQEMLDSVIRLDADVSRALVV
jgi:acyl-CoA thioesterase FadM